MSSKGSVELFLPHPILLGRVGRENPISILLEVVVLIGINFFTEEIHFFLTLKKCNLIFIVKYETESSIETFQYL